MNLCLYSQLTSLDLHISMMKWPEFAIRCVCAHACWCAWKLCGRSCKLIGVLMHLRACAWKWARVDACKCVLGELSCYEKS